MSRNFPRPQRLALNLCIGLWLLTQTLTMGGCDFATSKVPSPFSDKEVDAPTLLAESQREERKVREATLAEERADRLEAKRLATKAASDSIAATAKLDITAAEVKAELARIQAESGIAMQALAERSEARTRELQSALSQISEQTTAAFEVLDAQDKQRGAFVKAITDIPLLKTAASSFGIDLSSLGTLAGLGTAGVVLARRKKLADDTWDEAQKDAADKQKLIDAAWDQAHAHAMALMAPPPRPSTP